MPAHLGFVAEGSVLNCSHPPHRGVLLGANSVWDRALKGREQQSQGGAGNAVSCIVIIARPSLFTSEQSCPAELLRGVMNGNAPETRGLWLESPEHRPECQLLLCAAHHTQGGCLSTQTMRKPGGGQTLLENMWVEEDLYVRLSGWGLS